MYKNLFIAAAAVAVLASCTKNEVNPVSVPEQEISYQAVVGPKTKGLAADQKKFDTDNHFRSYAYVLENGKSWPAASADAQLYIDNADISYVEDVWKSNGHPYFWPKDGSTLTFFSWSTNSATTELTNRNVSCSASDGITVLGYNAASDNKNVDFMVADVAANRKENVVTYETSGVPTLFRHQLCQVKYKINLNHAYTAVKFYVKSVEFKGIYQVADYTQLHETSSWYNYKAADPDADKDSYPYASSKKPSDEWPYVGGTDKTLWRPTDSEVQTAGDQYYFIPQGLTDATMTIEYKIVTTLPGEVETTQNITKTIDLNKDTNSLFYPKGWEKNKIYTINITLGLDEILWDPAVQDWEEEDKNWSLID